MSRPAKHRILGRSIAGLDARDHSPLDLPLTSVVGSLASPLLNNGASQPAASPNPVSGNGNGGGNGNGNGNGNGHGGGNGGGNGGGSSGGGGSGNGGGSVQTPAVLPTPASGGGAAAPPPSIVPGPTPSPSASNSLSGSSGASDAHSGGSITGPSSQNGDGNFQGTVGGSNVPVTTSATLDMSTLATDSLASPQYSTAPGFHAVGTSGSSPSPTILSAAASSTKQLSSGAIAGIIIVCLISLLFLALLVVRRRSIKHRLELRQQWWFNRRNSSESFFLVSDGGQSSASRRSARSSFATNFDHGLMLRGDPPPEFIVPDLPPHAEVRERSSVLISTGGAVARRESMNSMLSNGSDPDTQYLAVPASQNNVEPSTPMSVRPFSPSESFAFPKPPAPSSSTVNSYFVSGTHVPTSSQSSATLVHLSTPPRAFMTDLPSGSVSTPPLPSPFIAAPNPSTDPFVDPVKPGFTSIEVVCRPFTPSLDDEMEVRQGDRVRLLQVFDDGWAFVEKLGDTAERCEKGLIPIDCLREAGEHLPTFPAEKRVSHMPGQTVAVAL